MSQPKDSVIAIVKARIEAEHRKYPDLDWALIAAHKIVSSLDEISGRNLVTTPEEKEPEVCVARINPNSCSRVSSLGGCAGCINHLI